MFASYCRLHVHVDSTARSVIRASRNRLNPKSWGEPKCRDARHAFYREMLDYHCSAQALFNKYRF